MSFNIAFAGKGGTGKTTIAGLTVKYLIERKLTPVLALDADANANLGDVLGVEAGQTVGSVREDVLEAIHSLPPGMTKESFMELKIQEALVESTGFDLLVMGRPEGPGCYCYANSIFRKYIDMIVDNYRYIVLDNEAGMEHLSRHMTQDVDLLLVISDATVRGIESTGRINELVDELGLNVSSRYLIINRMSQELPGVTREAIAATGLALAGVIGVDPILAEYDLKGRPLFELGAESIAIRALNDILDSLSIVKQVI